MSHAGMILTCRVSCRYDIVVFSFAQFRIQAISLGQGQGPVAEKLIAAAVENGHWVFLQVTHAHTRHTHNTCTHTTHAHTQHMHIYIHTLYTYTNIIYGNFTTIFARTFSVSL